MELIYKNITLKKTTDPVNLYFLGDEHIGHVCHDEDFHMRVIDMIAADPYARVIGMGDAVDRRNPDHKYFDFKQCSPKYQMKQYIKECYDDFKKRIKPIAKKYICLHAGNHDEGEKYGYPYIEAICEELNIAYAGYRAYTILKTGFGGKSESANRSYKIFSTHGYGGGRKSGSKLNRIEDEAANSVCDIYAMGHTHYLGFSHAIKQEPYFQVQSSSIQICQHELYFVNTGSFLSSYVKGEANYSERFGYKPQKTGCIMLQLFPHDKIITPRMIT